MNPRTLSLLLTALTVLLALPGAAAAQDSRPAESQPQSQPVMVPMPVPRSVIVPRGDKAIVLDGAFTDWPSVPVLMLNDTRQVSGSALGAYHGWQDISGQAFFCWDQDDLWFGANVYDDWVRPLPAQRMDELGHFGLPLGDSILLSFDPRRDTRAIGNDPGRAEDAEFWLGRDEGGNDHIVIWDRFRGVARPSSGKLVIGLDKDKKMLRYEARIPWREILPTELKPARGLCFDLNVVINDYDAPADPLPQTRIGWTFGIGTSIDPGIMGSLTLVGPEFRSGDDMPRLPDHPPLAGEPVPPPRFWIQFLQRLDAAPPVVVRPGQDPATTLGAARLDELSILDRELNAFPRVDFFELIARLQRRMQRELTGMLGTGVPHLFLLLSERLAREIQTPPTGLTVQRLWPGGFLVRSPEGTFAIDPQGPGVEVMEKALDFVAFTDFADLTRMHAPVVARVFARQRPILTHLSAHVPGIRPEDLPLATPGQEIEVGKLKVKLLGRSSPDGKVSPTVGYRVTWPDGRVLVHAGLALTADLLGAQPRVDWLILSVRHPAAANLVAGLKPALVVLEDALDFHRAPPQVPGSRVPLKDVLELQKQLAAPSVLLSWGETLRG